MEEEVKFISEQWEGVKEETVSYGFLSLKKP